MTLTTDFGLQDWFVGTMKGVIAQIDPGGPVIDITHGIPPGDIRAGAFALAAAARYFPKGSVHVAVIDPGVGSSRAGIAVQTDDYCFVGPDNGVLAWALRQETVREIRQLTNDSLFIHPVSQTFHGRDVFSPVAAYLHRGTPVSDVGPQAPQVQPLEWPEPQRTRGLIQGQIVYVDRFGNGLTNIPSKWIPTINLNRIVLWVGARSTAGLREFYEAIPPNQMAGIHGSSNCLEIAMNGASAAETFALTPGAKVALHVTSATSPKRE